MDGREKKNVPAVRLACVNNEYHQHLSDISTEENDDDDDEREIVERLGDYFFVLLLVRSFRCWKPNKSERGHRQMHRHLRTYAA